jgi:hypothetical protein
LFVPGIDHADLVAGTLQGIHDRIGLYAGQTKHGVDTVAEYRLHHGVAAGHTFTHQYSLS